MITTCCGFNSFVTICSLKWLPIRVSGIHHIFLNKPKYNVWAIIYIIYIYWYIYNYIYTYVPLFPQPLPRFSGFQVSQRSTRVAQVALIFHGHAAGVGLANGWAVANDGCTSCDMSPNSLCLLYITGWWYTYPSEKYEFVSWDDDIPNIWKNKKCSKPPTSIICVYTTCMCICYIYIYVLLIYIAHIHCLSWHCTALRYPTLHCTTLHYRALLYNTILPLCCITLSYITYNTT